MRSNLTLKKEALTDLTTEELGSVVAGEWTPSCPLFLNLAELLQETSVACEAVR